MRFRRIVIRPAVSLRKWTAVSPGSVTARSVRLDWTDRASVVTRGFEPCGATTDASSPFEYVNVYTRRALLSAGLGIGNATDSSRLELQTNRVVWPAAFTVAACCSSPSNWT